MSSAVLFFVLIAFTYHQNNTPLQKLLESAKYAKASRSNSPVQISQNVRLINQFFSSFPKSYPKTPHNSTTSPILSLGRVSVFITRTSCRTNNMFYKISFPDTPPELNSRVASLFEYSLVLNSSTLQPYYTLLQVYYTILPGGQL